MVHFDREKIFEVPLKMLRFFGESDSRTSLKLIIFRIINFLIVVLIFLFIILDFFQVEPQVFSDILIGLTSVCHVSFKYVLLIHVKHDTRMLTNFVVNKLNQFKQDVNETALKYVRRIEYGQKLIAAFPLITLYLYYFRAVLDADYFLMFESALSNSFAIDAVILLCQYYYICFGVMIVFGYDLMYFTLLLLTALLMRLLKRQITRIINSKDARIKDKFGRCIRHHKDLLLIYSWMNRNNSAMLLFHYLITMVALCSQLFMLVMYPSITNQFVFIFSLAAFLAEYACYTFSAEHVTSEFADLCVALYATKWYTNSVTFQKLILFMMMKSQRVQYFSGGGFVDINVDTFGTVIKKTFSFYAVMRNLLRR